MKNISQELAHFIFTGGLGITLGIIIFSIVQGAELVKELAQDHTG